MFIVFILESMLLQVVLLLVGLFWLVLVIQSWCFDLRMILDAVNERAL